MKKILLLCLIGFQSMAQTIYLSTEVDQLAEPLGGVNMLSFFITSNLRVPPKEASKKTRGDVMVKGIIETDGSMSNLKVISGIDSVCDKEAVRLMSLFKAWKPALVHNKPVRQSMTHPVPFQLRPNPKYDSLLNAYVFVLDSINLNKIGKGSRRIVVPLDGKGIVSEGVEYQVYNEGWEKGRTLPVVLTDEWLENPEKAASDSVRGTCLSIDNPFTNAPFYEMLLAKDGTWLAERNYNFGNSALDSTKLFYLNGVLKKHAITKDKITLHYYWDESGLLRLITRESAMDGIPVKERVFAAWDTDGTQGVYFGSGTCVLETDVPHVWQRGRMRKGLKVGRWVGNREDGSRYFVEYYKKGVLKMGTLFRDGRRIDYKKNIDAEYEKGMQEMYLYLRKNIQYPRLAKEAGIKGKVIISFVVETDGSLSNIEVVRSVDSGLDSEALRVVKGLTGKWRPAVSRGREVRMTCHLPINFKDKKAVIGTASAGGENNLQEASE